MSCCSHWQSSTSDLRPQTFFDASGIGVGDCQGGSGFAQLEGEGCRFAACVACRWPSTLGFTDNPPCNRACQAVFTYIHLCRAYRLRSQQTRLDSDWTLKERGLDFEDAALVFEGLTAEAEDKRKDYGETRIICFGVLQNRLVVIGYTPRGAARHVFSMRKANDREQARFAPYFGL